MQPEEIVQKFSQTDLGNKMTHAEVFTPISLINEILDHLPIEIWKDPCLKWLDPANGIGNFAIFIYTRLMTGLAEIIPDDLKRSQHILQNMLYMVELNSDHVETSRQIFGQVANIYCQDFLEFDLRDCTNFQEADVIVGNPPFHKPKNMLSKGGYGGKTLWDKFVRKSTDSLKKGGYLGFVTPANWRGFGEGRATWNLLSQRQIEYIHIYSKSKGRQIFKSQCRFDLYVLKNDNNIGPTNILDEVNKEHIVNLGQQPFLPNHSYELFRDILTHEGDGIRIIYSRYKYGTDTRNMRQLKCEEFIHPVVHSITGGGIAYWYSNNNSKGHFGEPKVILSFNQKQCAHEAQNDYKGEYGMTQIAFGIPISSKEEGDKIIRVISKPSFRQIIASTKWGAFQTDYRMFYYFKRDFYKYL